MLAFAKLKKLPVLLPPTGDSFCPMGDEAIGGRGGNEIASCILKWCTKHLPSNINSLTFWSDNCTGQNINIVIVYCYTRLVTKIPHLMSLDHKFTPYTSLNSGSGSPQVTRRIDTTGKKLFISKAVRLRFEKETPGRLLFQTCFRDSNFQVIDLRRNARENLQLPDEIPAVRKSVRPLETTKYRDLMTLLQYIPSHFRDYYKNLPHTSGTFDFPELDDEG
ncbi:hypothetical protein PR048_024371, partial [Dryococelus australis]